MASVLLTPRQLAPTVGPAAALAGVHFRTGSLVAAGKRVVCGLVHRFGTLNVISDNAGYFGNRPLSRNGCLVKFGDFVVYVATEVVCKYPERVHVAEDPPSVRAIRGQRIDRPADCAEVMVTLQVPAGLGVLEDPEDPDTSPRPARSARFPLEREPNRVDVTEPSDRALQATIERLGMLFMVDGDTEQARAQLEEHRKTVIREAEEVARAKREYELILREYNAA